MGGAARPPLQTHRPEDRDRRLHATPPSVLLDPRPWLLISERRHDPSAAGTLPTFILATPTHVCWLNQVRCTPVLKRKGLTPAVGLLALALRHLPATAGGPGPSPGDSV